MPSYPGLNFPFPRWVGTILQQKSGQPGTHNDNYDDYPAALSTECYACTQVGAPVFHSTSCDNAHQPVWEACAGSSLIPIRNKPGSSVGDRARIRQQSGGFGRVLDPRSKRVQRWNRAFLLARGLALAIDPLFFYALSIGREGSPRLQMDASLAAAATVLRSCVDAVHIFHLWLQFRLAYVSRESLVVGCGKLVWDARAIAAHYARSLDGFWFDTFVILPIPQAVFWSAVPRLIREEEVKGIVTILVLIFMFQFLPRVYHSISLMRRMQKVTGYIFGTIWWGFGLNLIAYFIASHVAGGCWYVLAIQRVSTCLTQKSDRKISLSCLDVNGPYRYGIYRWALPVVSSESLAVKVLYPIFWGLMTLSTFGNDLEPTSNWLEVVFSICIVLSGLMLFTLLIGNIQVFLHAVMAKKRRMQLRCRDMEWWMKRRQLPSKLRQRVRHFERHRWSATGGEDDDESELVKDFPEGLRRDIKRFLCLDLVKKVPFFQSLDDLVLDNICDRVKPLVFSKDEKIIREGDPVPRMVFVVKGRVKSSQSLGRGATATSVLHPGGFLGDELLSWCLRRPFVDRLPASSATFACVDAIEAFGLDAAHLRFITDHFRYSFSNDRLKWTVRYYSANWRTWAAVHVQLAWRRYRMRTAGRGGGEGGSRSLIRYAAMFLSIRPHDHLE